jgi:hypothetical protein
MLTIFSPASYGIDDPAASISMKHFTGASDGAFARLCIVPHDRRGTARRWLGANAAGPGS